MDRAVVYRLASFGHDVVARVRRVQAASRRLPSETDGGVPPGEPPSALLEVGPALIISARDGH
jgi:hypothetical protein